MRCLRECKKNLGLKRGFVVTLGEERRALAPDIEIMPWHEVAAGSADFGL